VFVSKAAAHNDQSTKMAKKVYARLEVDFSSKKRERCSPAANYMCSDAINKCADSVPPMHLKNYFASPEFSLFTNKLTKWEISEEYFIYLQKPLVHLVRGTGIVLHISILVLTSSSQ